MEHETFAQRLRGIRFWAPLLVLLLLGAGGYFMLKRDNPPSDVLSQQVQTLEPGLRRLIAKLEVNGFVCGDLTTAGPNEASCLINQSVARTELSFFSNHSGVEAWVAAAERSSKGDLASSGVIGYIIAGKRSAIRGTWSVSGGDADTSSGDAETAQDLNRLLKGCLELVPEEAGSCSL
ncbi:MAG: hypothetical protein H0U53_02360 [Actinobacteria bacterium]|nr:hypothetical protein [Actinomycetota bacterium]